MFRFLKNALVIGLVILIPVVVVYITIRELVQIMIGFATPIADLLPHGFVREDDPVELVAVILIVLTALLLGLLWTLPLTRHGAEWLEDKTIGKLPMYRMLKSLVAAFLDLEGEKAFQPAILNHEDGTLEPIFVIEDHGADHFVIMQPWTPTTFAGSIKLAPRDRVEFVQTTLDEYSLALTHFGIGLSETIETARQNGDQKD
jgi:uncharacterized membrane protein